MSAIRLARGVTGRTRIVKFAGNYHGHERRPPGRGRQRRRPARPPAERGAVPGSAGVPAVRGGRHDRRALQRGARARRRRRLRDRRAGRRQHGPRRRRPTGFLDGLRAECDRVGALLIFDEVITGFRVGRGGAQELFGVRPDLSCFGKVIGGGLNVGAFGGRADVMDHLAPLGPVYQAGTLSGNPLATAAGLAALELLDDDAYAMLADRAAVLAAGLQAALRRRRPRRRTSPLVGRSSACSSATTCPSTTPTPGRPTRRVYAALLPRPARPGRRPRARRLRGRCSPAWPTTTP